MIQNADGVLPVVPGQPDEPARQPPLILIRCRQVVFPRLPDNRYSLRHL